MKNLPLQFAKIALVVLAIAPQARAESVKADETARKGCIAWVEPEDAKKIIARWGFKLEDAGPKETRVLATTLLWIEKLNGGRPLTRANGEGDYTFRYENGKRNSHQAPDETLIHRNGDKEYGENIAQIAHELGHFVGNRDSKGEPSSDNNTYQDYHTYIGGKYCKVSSYSGANFHEQFAEIFAAFVTHPRMLRDSDDPVCQKAFKYFATKIFADGDAAAERCANRQEAVEDGKDIPDSAWVASTRVKPAPAAPAAPAASKPDEEKPAAKPVTPPPPKEDAPKEAS